MYTNKKEIKFTRINKLINANIYRNPKYLDEGSKPLYNFCRSVSPLRFMMETDVIRFIIQNTVLYGDIDDMRNHCSIDIPDKIGLACAMRIFENLDINWDGWVIPTT